MATNLDSLSADRIVSAIISAKRGAPVSTLEQLSSLRDALESQRPLTSAQASFAIQVLQGRPALTDGFARAERTNIITKLQTISSGKAGRSAASSTSGKSYLNT